MADYNELIQKTAAIEERELAKETPEIKGFRDYLSLAVATCGVGFIPVAPGTFGSLVGVIIYLAAVWAEANSTSYFSAKGLRLEQLSVWFSALNLILFLLFCLLSIWASNRATILFKDKDPQKVVVDEVIGQLLTFLFVPFAISGWLVFAGFLLFRLFDIWKPYPIDSLQNLPAGLGVCADDILAGVYAGICLLLIYAANITFF